MNNYQSLSEYLSGGCDPDYRPIPNKRSTAVIRRSEDQIAIRYHNTDVVTFATNGAITLNSGGWRTVTTKARFNEHLPGRWTVYQEAGIWYLAQGWGSEDKYIFADGITIQPDGTVTGAAEDAEKVE